MGYESKFNWRIDFFTPLIESIIKFFQYLVDDKIYILDVYSSHLKLHTEI